MPTKIKSHICNHMYVRQPVGFGVITILLILATTTIKAEQLSLISPHQVLNIPTELQQRLEREISPIKKPSTKVKALHTLLFSEAGLDIRYRANVTLTAEQTYHARVGNCLSLAGLVVASARHIGLKAKFQSVKVKRTWEKSDGFYRIPGHINVVIYTPRNKMVFEFIESYRETSKDRANSQVISDKRFFAEFHNNLGVVALENKNINAALSHFHFATQLAPKFAPAWSNLGVSQKYNGDYQHAEKSYRRALALNTKNLSVITNLYILLNEQNNTQAAAALTKKVERYTKKNPYYLAKLAASDLDHQRYHQAEKLIRRAISINKDTAEFYHLLARALINQGQTDATIKALARAAETSKKPDDMDRYQRKIAGLLASRH